MIRSCQKRFDTWSSSWGSRRSSRVRGTCSETVGVLHGPADFTIALVFGTFGQETAAALLKRSLRDGDSDSIDPSYFGGLLDSEGFVELLATRLEERPLDVEIHRGYQQALIKEGNEGQALDLYEALASELGTPAALYLYARLVADPAESTALLRRVVQGQPRSAWAHHGLAYAHLMTGNFEEAAVQCLEARGLDSDAAAFVQGHHRALVGAGRWGELLEELGEQGDPASDPALLLEILPYLAAAGRTADADVMIETLLREWPAAEYGPTEPWTAAFQQQIALGQGDLEAWDRATGETEDPTDLFYRALLHGDVAAAVEAIDAVEFVPTHGHLLLHLVAGLETDAGERALETAIAELGPDPESRSGSPISLPPKSRRPIPAG